MGLCLVGTHKGEGRTQFSDTFDLIRCQGEGQGQQFDAAHPRWHKSLGECYEILVMLPCVPFSLVSMNEMDERNIFDTLPWERIRDPKDRDKSDDRIYD